MMDVFLFTSLLVCGGASVPVVSVSSCALRTSTGLKDRGSIEYELYSK